MQVSDFRGLAIVSPRNLIGRVALYQALGGKWTGNGTIQATSGEVTAAP